MTTINYIKAVGSDSISRYFVPGEPIQLYRQRHDYELWPDSFSARPAEVFRLDPNVQTLMTQAIQLMWFNQIVMEGHGLAMTDLKRAWRWLTGGDRYMCNGAGTDTHRDYIDAKNLSKPLPHLFPLGLGGNVYRGVEEVYRGSPSLRVDTMTPWMMVPPNLCHDLHPWWIHYGTVSTRNRLPDGTYVVNPFSTLHWQGKNAPSPLMASQPSWISLDQLEKLPLGAPAPSPYNPPR